ncbi:MAG: hypothetical protein KDD19_20725 [Phaeodactylibacter sp.]|nr:hypothetical protein [Phaeodactylibacter sp.]MCB9051783.1 hypothetical protein [Lewinellaceae bacterium]
MSRATASKQRKQLLCSSARPVSEALSEACPMSIPPKPEWTRLKEGGSLAVGAASNHGL